ncbi:MAG: pilus assembly protein PilM [Deltaproteobacteria bacterium]|nr:pilus assembly protein PilM [Deltaproteobacteria bacterium]
MAQQLVAIDVSPKRVRVLLFEATFRSTEIVAAHTVGIEAGVDTPATLWPKIRALLPSQIDSVIVSADPAAVSTRLLTFPFDDVRKVDSALSFELESQIPYALDAVALTSSVAKRAGNVTQVLAAVTPKEGLAAQIQQCAAVGLEPRVMTFPAAVLGELVTEPQPEPFAVAVLGESQAHVSVINDKLVVARTIRAGSLSIDRVLAKRYNLDLDEARAAKEREGQVLADGAAAGDDVREASACIVEGLAPLLRQLTATLKALPAEHQPKKLFITGGLSRLPGLKELLAQRLGIAVELIDLAVAAKGLSVKVGALAPEYANALALGLALLRRGQGVPLNLRRGELAYRGDIQVYRSEMLRIGAGLAAVFVLAIVGSIARYTLISAEEAQIDQGFCKVTQKIVGREICDPMAALATLKHSSGTGEGVNLPPYSATDLYEAMSKMIGKDTDVSFDDLEFRVTGRLDDPDRITGKGEAATFEATEQIVVSLKKHPCIQDAEASKQRKTRNTNRVEFSFSAKVACPAGVNPVVAADNALNPGAPGTPPEAPPPESPGASEEP